MSKTLTLLMAYYDNPSMLRRHIAEWRNYDAATLAAMSFIVVDDCSPSDPAATVVRQEFGDGHMPFDLSVFRVQVDRPWGQDAARNIGMRVAETEWVLMTDMDHLLTRAAAPLAVEFTHIKARQGNYYMPGRIRSSGAEYHPHPNTFLFHRSDFWDMGGYDEDFVGWYGSDGNFRKCARGAGLSEKVTEHWRMVLYGAIDIHDANTRGLSRKEGEHWSVYNPQLNQKRMGPAYRATNPLRVAYERVL